MPTTPIASKVQPAICRIKGRLIKFKVFNPIIRNTPKVVAERSLPEQIGVCACPDELKKVAFDSVNEQPVARDVIFPAVSERALELVVSVLWRQRLTLGQDFDHGSEMVGILAPLLRQLDVTFELACPQDHIHASVSLYAEILEERFSGRKLLAMSLPGILDGLPRSRVRDTNIERQAAIKYDLAIEEFKRRRD